MSAALTWEGWPELSTSRLALKAILKDDGLDSVRMAHGSWLMCSIQDLELFQIQVLDAARRFRFVIFL